MKAFLDILGVLLILGGGIWFLQGINVLPGSFMTGQIRWAIYGGIAIVAGASLLVWNRRRKIRVGCGGS
jgi:LPXTG-motif cell wall-anchored protein